uniref:Fatty acid desaturase domain-containing protein n=1 Tax=Phaeomonas parva TaxID=124430 RepID=A0A7S1TV00_9STRA
MWMAPNPVTVAALSTWVFSRWTIIAHHTCHGGYNRVDAGRYHSRGFAIGSLWRRTRDWMDWMLPEAWSVEHNKLHHYRLGEDADPDLVERNLQWLREKDAPMALKYVMATALIPVWKWVYYAPNTFKELCIAEARKSGEALPEKFRPEEAVTVATLLAPQNEHEEAARDFIGTGRFFGKVLAPNFFLRFLALPAPLLLLPGGATLFGHALVNLALADLVTNIHSFIVIVTNHAGDDLYKFEDEVKPKTGSFYVRQIVSSTNFDLGSDKVDFAHGWLNYQIEHHVWDSMSPLQYQKGAPALREICEKHGVPYVKMNVFQRLKKTLDIMVGATDMLPFPADAEPKGDKRVRAAAAAAAAAN